MSSATGLMRIQVVNGLTLNTTLTLGRPSSGSVGEIEFTSSGTIGGTGTLQLTNSSRMLLRFSSAHDAAGRTDRFLRRLASAGRQRDPFEVDA